ERLETDLQFRKVVRCCEEESYGSEKQIEKEQALGLADRVRVVAGGGFYCPRDKARVFASGLVADIERAGYSDGFIFCTYNSDYDASPRCGFPRNGLDSRRRVLDG